jgi:predicted metal-binding membrane protein
MMATAGVSAPTTNAPTLARPRNVIVVVLIMLAAIGWGVVVWQSKTGGSMSRSMSMSGGTGLDLAMGMTAPLFLAMWIAMMVAMMFPSAAPMILLFDRIERSKRDAGRSYVPTAYFVGAYLAIWAAFGVLAFSLAIGVDRLSESSAWAMDNWARVGGGLLVAAGVYQLTPVKDRCLAKCRTPIAFLMTSWREGRAGAVEMGLLHGGYCLGCCWLLFVILLPLGVMNIGAMIVITLLVFGEKCLPSGPRLARLSAIALVIYGLVVIAVPGALPTTVV